MNGKPWNFGLGFLFSFLIFVFSQIFGFAFIFFSSIYFPYFQKNFGLSLTVGSVLAAILSIFLVLIFIYLSKCSTKEYLSLNKPTFKKFIIFFVIFASFIGSAEFMLHYYGIDTIPDFLIKAYKTTPYPILLFIVIIFFYPLYEEILFRGFLFKSIENSKLGGTGAILITSFLWSILHIQYNLIIISVIFIAGVIFGLSRLKTNSLYLPLTLHIIQNFVSSILFYFYVD